MIKTCVKCGQGKDETLFPLSKNGKGQSYRRNKCKQCYHEEVAVRVRAWRENVGGVEFKKKQANKKRDRISSMTMEERREMRRQWKCEAHKPFRPREELVKEAEERRKKQEPRRIKAISLAVYREWEKEQQEDYFINTFNIVKEVWCMPTYNTKLRFYARYRLEESFAIYQRVRRQIKKNSMLNGNVAETIRSAIRRNGNSRTVEDLLGYSIQELKAHMEGRFVGGMSWGSFMNGEIHIDHIKPQSLFDLTTIEGLKECWSLSNLQPLFARDNLAKGARYE
jgi:hypothetical protein